MDNLGSDVVGSFGDEYRVFFVNYRYLKGFDVLYSGIVLFCGYLNY